MGIASLYFFRFQDTSRLQKKVGLVKLCGGARGVYVAHRLYISIFLNHFFQMKETLIRPLKRDFNCLWGIVVSLKSLNIKCFCMTIWYFNNMGASI